MALKAKFNEVYPSSERPLTVWDNESKIKNYTSEIERAYGDKNAFRFAFLVSIFIITLFCILLGYMCVKFPRSELVVVSVNDLGEARYVGTTRGISMDEYGMRESCIKNVITTFIWNTYLISKDNDLMYEGFKNTLYFLEAKKRKSYMRFINSEDPFSDVGRLKRTSRIETIIPISPSSYQVDFYVTTSQLTGYGEEEQKMRGIFSIAQLDSDSYTKLSDEERNSNPLGIFITDYNIVEVKG